MLGLSVETHHTVEIKIAEGSLRRIQSSCQKTMLMVITNRLHLIFLLSHSQLFLSVTILAFILFVSCHISVSEPLSVICAAREIFPV